MTTYREVEAKNLQPGDAILHRYYDATGTYRETDVSVEATRVFTRKVRITWSGGYGTDSVPAGKVYGVKTDPFAGLPNADDTTPDLVPDPNEHLTLPDSDEMSDDDYEDAINGQYLRELFADSAADYGRDH